MTIINLQTIHVHTSVIVICHVKFPGLPSCLSFKIPGKQIINFDWLLVRLRPGYDAKLASCAGAKHNKLYFHAWLSNDRRLLLQTKYKSAVGCSSPVRSENTFEIFIWIIFLKEGCQILKGNEVSTHISCSEVERKTLEQIGLNNLCTFLW